MNCSRYISSIAWLVLTTLAAGQDVITGQVVAVDDGDTMTVLRGDDELRVRLFAVDCPELEQEFGEQAKGYTSGMVAGTVVTVEVKGADDDGALVGVVHTADDRVVNHALLRAGLAMVWRPEAEGSKELAQLQASAMLEKKGIWTLATPLPPWEYRRGQTGKVKVLVDPIEVEKQRRQIIVDEHRPSHSAPAVAPPAAASRPTSRTRLIDLKPIDNPNRGDVSKVPQQTVGQYSVPQTALGQQPVPQPPASQYPLPQEGVRQHPVSQPPASQYAIPQNSATSAAPQATERTVYRTDTGKKYHNAGCQYLKDSQHEIASADAQAQGLTACSRCF